MEPRRTVTFKQVDQEDHEMTEPEDDELSHHEAQVRQVFNKGDPKKIVSQTRKITDFFNSEQPIKQHKSSTVSKK